MWTVALGIAALAQDTGNPTVAGWDLLPSAERRWLDAAFTTTGRAWGAASFLDRQLFPSLASTDETALLLAADTTYLYDVLEVPVRCDVSLRDVASEPYCLAHLDAFAATGGIAAGTRNLGVFYAASLNGIYGTDIGFLRGMAPAVFAPWSVFQLYTAPFSTGPLKIGPGMQDLFGTSRSEYVVGLRGQVAGVAGHAGFLGSDDGSGLFTNVTEERVHALVTAVLRQGADALPFFEAGLVASAIPELLGADARVRPSLFARKIDFGDPVDEESGFDLWSGHTGTTSPWVDFTAAFAWEPDPMFHELTVTLHNPTIAPAVGSPSEEEAENVGFALTGGFVRLPDMPWYGLAASPVPFVEGRAGIGPIDLTLGWNSRDTLVLFPYARNAVKFGLQLRHRGGK